MFFNKKKIKALEAEAALMPKCRVVVYVNNSNRPIDLEGDISAGVDYENLTTRTAKDMAMEVFTFMIRNNLPIESRGGELIVPANIIRAQFSEVFREPSY